jgi:hypothetical protein
MPPGDAEPPPLDELAAAVEGAIATNPTGRERDALCAFVRAWHRQWPRTFVRAFGAAASQIDAWAVASIADLNRHIKLSRIAMAHLAHVL